MADPIQEAWLAAKTAQEAGCPDSAELGLAALNGPASASPETLAHLRSAGCDRCQYVLSETWSMRCPPTHVVAATQNWPADSVFRSALAVHVDECEEARCSARAQGIEISSELTEAEPSARWLADLRRRWGSLTSSELRDRLGDLRAGLALTLTAPPPAPAGMRFRGPLLSRTPGERAPRGSAHLEFAIRKSIVFRPEAEDLDLFCTFSFTPADRAFKVELKNLPNVLVGKHLLLLFPNWNSVQAPEIVWSGQIPGIVPVGQVPASREVLGTIGTLSAAGEHATFTATFDECRIASEEGSGSSPDFLLTLHIAGAAAS